jgi:hypothetical protein
VVCCVLFLGVLRLLGQPVEFPGHNVRLHPCGAFDGTDSHIVWEELRGDGSDILSARLDGNLHLLDSVPVVISAAPRNQSNPAIVWNAHQFLCVWEDARNGGSDVYGARIESTGVVLDPAGIPIRRASGIAKLPQVAAGDSDFLVVWEETPPDSDSYVCGVRVASDGSLRDTVPIRISRLPGRQAHPSVAYASDLNNYAVVWEQHSPEDESVHVLGARVSDAGFVIDTIPVRLCRIASRQTAPSIAYNDLYSHYRYLVVWEDDRMGVSNIFGTSLGTNLVVVDTVGSRGSNDSFPSSHPRVADVFMYTDNHFEVDWQESQQDGSIALMQEEAWYELSPSWCPPVTAPASDVLMPCFVGGGPGYGFILCVVDPHDPASPSSIVRTEAYIMGINERMTVPCGRSVLLSVTPSLARDRFNVSYSLSSPGAFALRVYDLCGKLVTTLREGSEAQGRLTWEPRGVSRGIYFIRLESAAGNETAKVILE